MRSLLLVPVVALVIAGCGSGSSNQLGSVHSASQVVDYMGKHGFPCTDVQPNKGAAFVREELDCTVDGESATIDVWNSNSQRATLEKAFSSFMSGATVEGDKWSISVESDAEARKIQKVTGGTVH
jgi:hypothetical protein